MFVTYVKTNVLDMLESSGVDVDGNNKISRGEFMEILMRPDTARMLSSMGVDVPGMVDYVDVVFKEGADTEITFEDFIKLVLSLRGNNQATVKDMVDLRRIIIQEIADLKRQIDECNVSRVPSRTNIRDLD